MPHISCARLVGHGEKGNSQPAPATLECNDGFSCRVQAVSSHIFRVLFTRPTGLRQPRTWAVVPPPTGTDRAEDALPSSVQQREHARDTPVEGWDRLAIPFATSPCHVAEAGPSSVSLQTEAITLKVNLSPFGFEWYARGTPEPLCQDRPSRPYHFSSQTQSFSHSVTRKEGDVYMGLGDKTGRVNLHGRRVRIGMRDALGYDPESGDPLYKHWPFLLVRDSATTLVYGVLYDNMAEAAVDLGCEHSNYYGLYRTYEAQDGDLDMYFILGPDVSGAVSRMVQLIGGTGLMPRWSLGFHCTAMPLADAPDAQKQMEAFIAQSVASSVPCSAFHFGSGYTSIGKRRYVFHWNKDKFPDPSSLISHFHKAGMRVVANVKPCLLTDHQSFAELAREGGFVAASLASPSPAISQFWDGEGAHVDFTNPTATAWWQKNLQSALFDLGICSAWNDNNEYEITEELACSNSFGAPQPLSLTRPLHSLLMTRASIEQQLSATSATAERPYSVTRAGFFGTQRYAQTWTGDNSTNWKCLRWNLRMGLTLGLSGMFNVGHDVGGFSGPAPDPELLVRWVQAGALQPRFIMNSWKADGTVTTPWMHPAVLPATRWAIRLRYRLLPYLYSLLLSASLEHAPVLRPTFFEFPGDPRCWGESDELLLGSSVLAAPVVEQGARQRTLYLPKGSAVDGWFDFFSEEYYPAGKVVTVAAPLSSIPLFVPAGAVIPMTGVSADFSRLHDEPSRIIRVFPPPSEKAEAFQSAAAFFEDNGLTLGSPRATVTVQLKTSPGSVEVSVKVEGSYILPYRTLGVSLPAADTRSLSLRVEGASGVLQLQQQMFSWHSLNQT